MFNSIRGRVSEKTADSLRLDTDGIEWEISMPSTDLLSLPEEGEEARVFVFLQHKEESMRLFGFIDEGRRAMFLDLLKIDGIGPRSAIKIMRGISRAELESALDREDLASLEAVPGISKKIAQKMILSLKGKLSTDQGSGGLETKEREILEALVQMGYDRRAS